VALAVVKEVEAVDSDAVVGEVASMVGEAALVVGEVALVVDEVASEVVEVASMVVAVVVEVVVVVPAGDVAVVVVHGQVASPSLRVKGSHSDRCELSRICCMYGQLYMLCSWHLRRVVYYEVLPA